MKIRQKDIDQALIDYGMSHGRTKEDYFSLFYLMRKFTLSYEEAQAHVAFGNNDYGFDGFHFDREARNLYIYINSSGLRTLVCLSRASRA